MKADPEFRHHWQVVLACVFGLMVSTSPVFITPIGLFFGGFARNYGWTRGEASLAVALASFVGGALSPVAGWAIDRFGVRPVVLVGTTLLPAALLGFGVIPLTYPIYLTLGFMVGLAASIMSPASFLNLPPQYFDRRLGLAIGLAILGLGLGQMTMPFVVERFIAWFGDRVAWIALAATVATIGLANAFWLVRDNPRFVRARRDADETPLPGFTAAEAVRDAFFWQSTVTFLLIIMVTSGLALHLPAILADRGYPPQAGAAAISLIGLGSILARLITGAMLDRLSPAVPATLFFGGQVAGILLIWGGVGGAAPFIAALLIGGSLGAEGDMMPFVLRRAFGMRAFGRIYGLCFGCFQLGAVAGTLLIGLAFDFLGSYDRILLLFSATSSVATMLMLVASANLARRAHFGSRGGREIVEPV